MPSQIYQFTEIVEGVSYRVQGYYDYNPETDEEEFQILSRLALGQPEKPFSEYKGRWEQTKEGWRFVK